MITKHASDRMKQRGFNQEHINFILRFGEKKRVGSAFRYQITKKIAKNLRFSGYSLDILDKCKSSYVVSLDKKIITVAHIH